MTELPRARFLFPISRSNFRPFQHRREKLRNCPRRDFCFRSAGQILSHYDAVAKNDEIAPGTIFVLRSAGQILAHSDIVAKNYEIAPGEILLFDQPVKF
jgi:hypothetical protein